ncbi:hypothetical protein ACUXV3_19510 (plasmid) [Roseobacteraceae bacterium NS-SX3]
MRYALQFLSAAIAAWALPFAAAAGADGLYDAPAPHDAVYLRRIGAAQGPVKVFGRSIPAGELPEQVYTAASAAGLPGAEPGRHYSLFAGPHGSTAIVREPRRDDPAKVYLFLLNRGSSPARLLAGGGTQVIGNTGPAAIGARAVNPVSAELHVETATRSEAFTVTLRRDQDLTFLVTEDAISLVPHIYGPVIGTE